MKVKILGFEWRITSGATLPQFFAYLRSISGHEFDDNVVAMTPLNQPEGMWAGVVLTIKDQRSYTELRRRRLAFTVTPKELEANTNIADVNFFMLSQTTGRGLYQYYHHSMALASFGYFARSRFREFQSVNNIDRGQLRHSMLIRPESFEEVIDRMRTIKVVQFEAVTYRPSARAFRSLDGMANRKSHRLVFFQHDDTPLQRIKSEVKSLLHTERFAKIRIEGHDEDGIERVHKLYNEPDVFSEYEYDEFVSTVNLDNTNFQQTIIDSAVVRRLAGLYAGQRLNALLTVPEAP